MLHSDDVDTSAGAAQAQEARAQRDQSSGARIAQRCARCALCVLGISLCVATDSFFLANERQKETEDRRRALKQKEKQILGCVRVCVTRE
jgi:hypothetical protein